MKCSKCSNPNVTDIRGEGGAIVARYCGMCGKKGDQYGEEIVAVSESKPSTPPGPKVAECEHPTMQKVESLGGEVIGRVCGLCHAKFRLATCCACGRDVNLPLTDRSKFPACDSTCSKVAAKARAKAKRQAEAALEAKEREA